MIQAATKRQTERVFFCKSFKHEDIVSSRAAASKIRHIISCH